MDSLALTVPPRAYLTGKTAEEFLVLVDHVVAMDYLDPDLRQRVLRLQEKLIRAERIALDQSTEGSNEAAEVLSDPRSMRWP